MKNLCFFLVMAIFPFLGIHAQQTTTIALEPVKEELGVTYNIPNITDFPDAETYIRALNKADLHLYRLRSKPFTLKFDSGLLVEVFSANDLDAKALLLNAPSEYPEEFSAERSGSVFQLGANDYILESRPVSISKKTPR